MQTVGCNLKWQLSFKDHSDNNFYQMTKQTLSILFFILLVTNQLFSQDILLESFESQNFNLKYPKKWKLDSSDNKYSFYYNPGLGDITISIYESQKSSAEELKQMLLNLNEKKENKPDIQLSDSNGTISCLYKYTTDKVKYYVKAVQNEKKLYLISLNWNEDSWESFKEILLNSFNSFTPK